MKESIHLSISRLGRQLNAYDMAPGIYAVGSDQDNQLVLPGEEIAEKHAILSLLPGRMAVEDLNAPGGVYLDGHKVQGRASLASGSRIGMGPYIITLGPEEEAVRPLKPAPVGEPAPAPESAPQSPPMVADGIDEARRTINRQIHDELLNRLDLKRLTAGKINRAELREKTHKTIRDIVRDVRRRLPSGMDAEKLIKDVYDEAVGLGPIEDLLEDDEITEIMVNGASRIYIEKAGRLHRTDRFFLDDDSVLAVIERIVSPIGRRIDESQPYVDARLPDGSRVNAIIPPLSLTGPCLTIRKFSKRALTIADMIRFGTLTPLLAEFLDACVMLRKNIVVSGGTGSGKTTLLNVISSFLPDDERIITIEDAAELRLTQDHVLRQEARPPNIEGRGAITIRDLVRNALRMRPDRIVVGECRGGEALDMLQAMNTGHEGSLTTVHANSPRDVISRLETMVLMSGMELPVRAIREQIGAAIHLIVHTSRYVDGSRKIARIAEVVGLEGDQITMQDIFTYTQTGMEGDAVVGRFMPTGNVPTFIEETRIRGIDLNRRMFDPRAWNPS